MKMKNLFIVSALTLLLAGCSQIFPPAIYSPKAMGDLIADLKEIGKNYEIEQIRIFEKDKLSNEFGMAHVYTRNDKGEKFEQNLYYNYGIPNDDPKPRKEYGVKRKEPHAINIEDIVNQKDNIEKYVEIAKTAISEEFENKYSFESVNDLVFTADDAGNLLIKFEVNVTEKGKSARREGGRMVTDYYKLTFNVDKDGNVSYED